MKFNELKIGDWFTSPQDEKAVFIKTASCSAVHMGNHVVFSDEPTYCSVFADPEEDIEFCSHFIWDSDNEDTCRDESYNINESHSTTEFNQIPVGGIYRGKGNTWYRKTSPTDAIVIWSVNTETMGKIYTRKENSRGTFSICVYWEFSFPEVEEIKEKEEKVFAF